MTQWEYTVQLRGNDVRQYYPGFEPQRCENYSKRGG